MSAATLAQPTPLLHSDGATDHGVSASQQAPSRCSWSGSYLVYSGPPPVANVLGRNLITVVTFTGFLIFAVGLSRLLRSARGGDARTFGVDRGDLAAGIRRWSPWWPRRLR